MTEGTVLLESAKPSFQDRKTLYAHRPEEIYAGSARSFSWNALRRLSRRGVIIGYLGYEAATGSREPSSGKRPPAFWFGRYDRVRAADLVRRSWEHWRSDGGIEPASPPQIPRHGSFRIGAGRTDMDRARYMEAVEAIRRSIAEGSYYQVNLTIRRTHPFSGDPFAFYRAFLDAQPVPFGAFIDTGSGVVAGGSPELFLRFRKGMVTSKPMKGTAPVLRGSRRALRASEKDRAENLMITDLVRNDLGRVCTQIHVPSLFRVERYRTLFQMVSVVRGRLLPGADPLEALRAASPPGSITGAPKSSSMIAISELETSPRGVYTGIIGYLTPWGDGCFSVAIRTALIHRDRLTYGIGSGVTFASRPQDEWRECLQKAAALESLRT